MFVMSEVPLYAGLMRADCAWCNSGGPSLKNLALLTYSSVCLGPCGGPIGGGVFLSARYPCTQGVASGIVSPR